MPYTKQKDRDALRDDIEDLQLKIIALSDGDPFGYVGHLNYAITSLALGVMPKLSYSQINAVIVVLECAKQEFYARLARPYEDRKIEENGDIPLYDYPDDI